MLRLALTLTLLAALGLQACAEPPPGEPLVATWEALGALLVEQQGDCDRLQAALDAFHAEHAAAFAPERRAEYEVIIDHPAQRLRLARALDGVRRADYACSEHEGAQAAAQRFVLPLLSDLAPSAAPTPTPPEDAP